MNDIRTLKDSKSWNLEPAVLKRDIEANNTFNTEAACDKMFANGAEALLKRIYASFYPSGPPHGNRSLTLLARSIVVTALNG